MSEKTNGKKRVLITGAAGRIGYRLCQDLREVYDLRAMYHHTIPEKKEPDYVIADIADFEQVRSAMQGMDAVVHMAADPSMSASWEAVLSKNIIGTYNIYETARLEGAKRIVFGSTNHVVGYYEIEKASYVDHLMPVRPDSLYGVSKEFGETLGRFYVDKYGMEIICLRIGSAVETIKPSEGDRILATWLSPRDMAQLVRRSIETHGIRFDIFNAISGNTRRFWDISHAQEVLGYAPEDNAEDHLP